MAAVIITLPSLFSPDYHPCSCIAQLPRNDRQVPRRLALTGVLTTIEFGPTRGGWANSAKGASLTLYSQFSLL
jgi:hypothetical protein